MSRNDRSAFLQRTEKDIPLDSQGPGSDKDPNFLFLKIYIQVSLCVRNLGISSQRGFRQWKIPL